MIVFPTGSRDQHNQRHVWRLCPGLELLDGLSDPACNVDLLSSGGTLAFSLRELGSALLNSARVAVLSSVGPLIIATANGGREMPIAATCAAGVLAVGGWVFGLRLTGHILF
jgi:hypothetical protein